MSGLGELRSVGRSWSAALSGNLSRQSEELLVTTVNNPPLMILDVLANGTCRCDGYLYELWDTVAKELGLRYRMVPLLKSLYGSIDANGTWNGMVGELAYGRADIAVTTLDMRSDRAAVIDYIDAVSVTTTHSKFYVRAGSHAVPEVSAETVNSLLKPLHQGVWWSVLGSLVVVSAVLRAALRLGHARSESRRTVHAMTWSACLLSSFRSLVGQGWESEPSSLATRIVTACSWMLGIIIYASYTANLISHLTTVTMDLPITSLEEFHEQPGWRLAIQPGHSILNDWKRSKDPNEYGLYQRSEARDGIIDIYWSDRSTWRTLEPKVLTYVNIDPVFRVLHREACSLTPIPSLPVKSNEVYMAIAKGRGELRRDINQMMRKLNEEGLLKRIKSQWIRPNDALCESTAGFKEMTFGDVFVILMIVPLGVGVSVAVGVCECLWWRYGKRWETKGKQYLTVNLVRIGGDAAQ